METNTKTEETTVIEQDKRCCCRVRIFVPLRVKAWSLLIIFGGVLTAILYGILYATTYPKMSKFQESIVLQNHVHSLSLVDRSILDLTNWGKQLLSDGIVKSTLKNIDSEHLESFKKMMNRVFYVNGYWKNTRGISGYALYDSEANLLVSDHHRCSLSNASICGDLVADSSALPKVFQNDSQFMRDILSRDDDKFSGIITVDKDTDPNTPIYLFSVEKVNISDGTIIGMRAMFRDLRLAYPFIESNEQCCVSFWDDLETSPDDVAKYRAEAVNVSIDMTLPHEEDYSELHLRNKLTYLDIKDLPESDRRVCSKSVYDSIFLALSKHINVLYSYVVPPDPNGTGTVDEQTKKNKYGLSGVMIRFDVARTIRNDWERFLIELGAMIIIMYLFAAISFLISLEFTVFKPLREAQRIMRKSIQDFLDAFQADHIFDTNEIYANKKKNKDMEFAVKDVLADSHMLNRESDDITVLTALANKSMSMREKQIQKQDATLEKLRGGNLKDRQTLHMLNLLSGRDEESLCLLLPGLNDLSASNPHKELKSIEQLLSSPIGLMCFKHYCSEKGSQYVTSVMFMLDIAYMYALEHGENISANYIVNPSDGGDSSGESSPLSGSGTSTPRNAPSTPMKIGKAHLIRRSMTMNQLAQMNPPAPRRTFFPRKNSAGAGERKFVDGEGGDDSAKTTPVDTPDYTPRDSSRETPVESGKGTPKELLLDDVQPISALPKNMTRFRVIRSSHSAANLMSAAVTGEASMVPPAQEIEKVRAQIRGIDASNKGPFKTSLGAKAAKMIYLLYFDYRRCRRFGVRLIGVSNCAEYAHLVRDIPSNWNPRMYDPVAAAVSKALSEVFNQFRNSTHYNLLMLLLTAQTDSDSTGAPSALPPFMQLLWPAMCKPKTSNQDKHGHHHHRSHHQKKKAEAESAVPDGDDDNNDGN